MNFVTMALDGYILRRVCEMIDDHNLCYEGYVQWKQGNLNKYNGHGNCHHHRYRSCRHHH